MARIYDLNQYLKETFGEKVYKISLDGGMTCPNRDGVLGTRGCIFCSAGGSGDFAQKKDESILLQIEGAKSRISSKTNAKKFIAYFQSYTNTYQSINYLSDLFGQTLSHPDVVALSVGTRPDCLEDDVISLLSDLNRQKPVWVELGLQTIHSSTAEYIRRGYDLDVYEDACLRLRSAGLQIITHVILGLPGESKDKILETIDYLSHVCVPDGIKLQLLHVLRGTDLASDYEKGLFATLSMEEYFDILFECIRHLPPDMVIHRLTGDGPKRILIAPAWSANKKMVLNALHREMELQNVIQGSMWVPDF